MSDDVWKGRLAGGLDPRARALNDSLRIDRRLWPEEIALTRGYAPSLVEAGVMTAPEMERLLAGCDGLEADLEHDVITLEGEDVHSAVEAELVRRCGAPGLKLHTGRSRNDQVVTLLRMHLMRVCDETVAEIQELERALLKQARSSGDAVVAAATHLQPAQPMLMAHVWLAHGAAFERDEERFQSAREAADRLSLGAAALAGTPLRYDRLGLAQRLGFTRLAENSLDAVGDRDFALEYLQAAAALGVHLSRLGEDLVLWCSPGFGWYAPPDGFSTGSSLLPQKRNPDLFELMRGKAARLITNAERLAVVLKGLPTSYQKDLQEDKEAVFDTEDSLAALLAALPPAIRALEPKRDRMAAGISVDLLAVELADDLVAEGVPFREAHALVGRLWAAAEYAGVAPAALSDAVRLGLSPHFTPERLGALSVERALARRNHSPGTGPKAVAAELMRAEARLGLGFAEDGDESGGARPPALSPALSPAPAPAAPPPPAASTPHPGVTLHRAQPNDVPALARLMAEFVADGTLLPRPIGELFQSVREFQVAVGGGRIVACAALKILWGDLGEVRSLVVHPDFQGNGLGRKLVDRLLDDARELELSRVIALTREVEFFERAGFHVVDRESLSRKVWTDCIHCARRHACDETAVALDLRPAAAARPARGANGSWVLPLPPPAARVRQSG